MNESFITINAENIMDEHLCCAISDKKHQHGVAIKKDWLKERIKEGHVFRKLDAKAKVFIEYAPLENAWVPVDGENYMYIYCLWVSGSYKGKGYAKKLLESCIHDAKSQNMSGVCILSSKKKKPFLSDKKFMTKFGFETVDSDNNEYELLALSFDGTKPAFSDKVKEQTVDNKDLTVYYSMQCPYIPDCIKSIDKYCNEQQIPHTFIPVDSLETAKNLPCVFNNWVVFYKGNFETLHLLNEGTLKKMLEKYES